ncbi:hypothetical protein PTW37_10185 [Arthrobacter agilis]|uniref:hypothetical protein n=1 Tax=Arthrobacter agilis TaxID=37921 RepID=UPI0023653397|nr:hypothetical protein [Arthrobacter agilis]WDF32242.1 hypothetical protein PTW37_10185 [Arthrobacter agilis]
MPEYPQAARDYDLRMRRLSIRAIAAGKIHWRSVSAANISASWEEALGSLVPTVTKLQLSVAAESVDYVSAALAGQGLYEAPDGFADPRNFAGVAPDGRSLSRLLLSPATRAKTAIGAGASVTEALAEGGRALDMLMKTTISDTGRAAASVDLAARPRTGYVRMLNLPSCGRCVVMAGRFYRWNAGFLRHPRCDCRHIPSTENAAGDLRTDAYEAFNSYTPAQQDKHFGKAGAQAIRDGADISQVVNSRRGMSASGLMTKEGTSKRGNFRQTSGRTQRLTPQAIYQLNNEDRTAAVKDLERYGYILPGGQNPLGALRGQREGYGALGRGGTRVGATAAVDKARETGVRDPRIRATMTAAERRLADAESAWRAVQQGRNPAGRSPLTPVAAAKAESEYRRLLRTNGEVFAR